LTENTQLEGAVAEIVLFHSILGLRPGVMEAADRLRAAGHVVHTPDLFSGDAPLDSYEEGTARVERIGVPEIVARAMAVVGPLGPNLVYAGFSMGSGLAAGLAARRPGARGAVLMSGAPNPASVGATSWPAGVPCQIHMSADDPSRRQDWIDELAALVRGSGSTCDVNDYPGSGHLFADPGLPAEYDAASADLMWTRVLEFVAGL
jgi:dienelactone hydrolase